MTCSLRRRLLVGTACGFAVILMGAGVALYFLMHSTLVREFDSALQAQARTLADLIEQEGNHIDLEFEEADLSSFRRADHPDYFQVWLEDGSVLHRSPSLGTSDMPWASVADDLTLRPCALPDDRPGRCVWLRFTPRIDSETETTTPVRRVVLGLARGTEGVNAALGQLRITLLLVGSTAVVLSVIILAWLVHVGLRPARQLAERIHDIDEHRLTERIAPHTLPLELRPIAAQLNGLLDRLAAVLVREKAMTASVAHELRTPLAGLRSILEVAVAQDRNSAEYRKALEDCHAICLQTQLIVDNILALARLDAQQEPCTREPVDLDTLIRRSWAPYKGTADDRRLQISWEVVPNIVLNTDQHQLGLVLKNLFDNAVHYTNHAGHIAIASANNNGSATICISNTGSHVATKDVHRVFERFWRGDRARQQDGGRCGLGLPLCRMIVERLGGQVVADSTPAGEFRVLVNLHASGTA